MKTKIDTTPARPASVNTFVQELLRFKDLRVLSYHFDRAGGDGDGVADLHLHVRPAGPPRCPCCGRPSKIVRTQGGRKWRDLPVHGRAVWLHYAPREVRCPKHGRRQEHIPWATPHSRVTHRLEFAALTGAASGPQREVAARLGMPTSTFSELIHRCVGRARDGHRPGPLRHIGIDEISYKKGHKYLTLVYDLERSAVVWIGEGKGRATIDRFFTEVLGQDGCARIEAVTCDMAEAYVNAAQEHCPNAAVVLDRFHVVQALNAAMDEVRKEAWREASAQDRRFFKGLRWILMRSPSSRSRADAAKIKALERSNNRIYRAWRLKDQFEHFWQYIYTGAAEKFLKAWTRRALLSRLEPMRKFAMTIRAKQQHLLTYIDTGLTNATAEGINRIARQIRNWSSGFRGPDNFADIIYLRLGDLDIPGQIPEHHRIG